MDTSDKLVEKESPKEKDNPEARKTAVLTLILQIIPWLLFIIIYLLDTAIKNAIPIGAISIISWLCLIFILCLLITATIGLYLVYNNSSNTISVALMVIVNLLSAAFVVTFGITFFNITNLGIYPLIAGLPFLILSVCHLIIPISSKGKTLFQPIYSSIIWIISSGIPALILVIHSASYDNSHPHMIWEIIIATIIIGAFSAAWCSCFKVAMQLRSMNIGNRFFFIYSGMIIYGLIFFLGITVFPIIFGLKFICAKIKAPSAPPKPGLPLKPDKPVEPKVGANPEEWNLYRKNLDNYREGKRKWKEEKVNFKKHEQEIMKDYYNKYAKYRQKQKEYETAVIDPAKGTFCKYCSATAFHVMFCRKTPSVILLFALKKHEGYSELAMVNEERKEIDTQV